APTGGSFINANSYTVAASAPASGIPVAVNPLALNLNLWAVPTTANFTFAAGNSRTAPTIVNRTGSTVSPDAAGLAEPKAARKPAPLSVTLYKPVAALNQTGTLVVLASTAPTPIASEVTGANRSAPFTLICRVAPVRSVFAPRGLILPA